MTLSGLRSRWTRPAAWAAARPRPASRRTARTSGQRRGWAQPGAEGLAVDVLHGDPDAVARVPTSWIATTLGWARRASAWASRSRRASRPTLASTSLAEFGAQQLEGDLAVELGVEGGVDDAHAAGAERREHEVAAERREPRSSSAASGAAWGCDHGRRVRAQRSVVQHDLAKLPEIALARVRAVSRGADRNGHVLGDRARRGGRTLVSRCGRSSVARPRSRACSRPTRSRGLMIGGELEVAAGGLAGDLEQELVAEDEVGRAAEVDGPGLAPADQLAEDGEAARVELGAALEAPAVGVGGARDGALGDQAGAALAVPVVAAELLINWAASCSRRGWRWRVSSTA
jgi:hypothetical protein